MHNNLLKHKNAILIMLLHLFLLANTQFTPWPELHLWPYLMEHGYKLYTNIAFEKPPLLAGILYAWFHLFGNSVFSLKLITWCIILLIDLLIYTISTKSGPKALITFVFLQVTFQGNGLWFDLLITPLLLLIYILLTQKKYFLTGIFWGLAILTKQTAILMLVPILISLGNNQHKSNVKSLFLGTLSPILIISAYMYANGLIKDMMYWIIRFSPAVISLSYKIPTWRELLTIVILTVPLWTSIKNHKLISVFGLVSLSFIYPRFELFHLQPILPFIAISTSLANKNKSKLEIIYFAFVIFAFLHFLNANWHKPDRFYEDSTISMAAWIKSHTKPYEKIFLLNTWDHLYALSNTLPVGKVWYHYLPWYLAFDSVQKNIVHALKSEKPRLVISENLPTSPSNEVESYLHNAYAPDQLINNRFTIWRPKL